MPVPQSPAAPIRIAIGGDHAGFPLKQLVAEQLASEGFAHLVGQVVDCGTNSTDSCDYPDFAIAVAQKITPKTLFSFFV